MMILIILIIIILLIKLQVWQRGRSARAEARSPRGRGLPRPRLRSLRRHRLGARRARCAHRASVRWERCLRDLCDRASVQHCPCQLISAGSCAPVPCAAVPRVGAAAVCCCCCHVPRVCACPRPVPCVPGQTTWDDLHAHVGVEPSSAPGSPIDNVL
jgi:hypothetical protein